MSRIVPVPRIFHNTAHAFIHNEIHDEAPILVQRLVIRYSGRVQGVGFRATCVRLAEHYQVTGRVCNLTNGQVELLAEGESEEIRRFIGRIAVEMSRNIVEQHERWEAAQGSWDRFAAAADKHP